MLPEHELLHRAHQFDSQALAQIYDLYSPVLYRYAMRQLGDPVLAEECVGESFTRFLEVLRKNRGPQDNLRAYLYRIAHNWITDQYRRAGPPEIELDCEFPSNGEESPPIAVNTRLRQQHIRRALMTLTQDQRQVIVLKFLEDLENDEISRFMHKPIGAVKSLQHRALATLQRILLDEDQIG
jgi:RNA polymerase sigma-70 factor (ECF subfamily)